MKFYEPGRHQAATQIGAYFALLETIKGYQNEEIEPLGGEQRSRRVALQVLAMFPAWGGKMWVRWRKRRGCSGEYRSSPPVVSSK